LKNIEGLLILASLAYVLGELLRKDWLCVVESTVQFQGIQENSSR